MVAWYQTLRDAEGQVETKRSEVTEKVFYSGRKAVAAKDVVATIETWEGELREYTSLTGLAVENTLKLLNLERMLPEAIKKMLQTVEIKDYTEAKEYATNQARVLLKEKDPKAATLDLNEDEEEKAEKKKVTFDDPPEKEEGTEEKKKKKVNFPNEDPEEEKEGNYTRDELLAWIGKGP